MLGVGQDCWQWVGGHHTESCCVVQKGGSLAKGLPQVFMVDRQLPEGGEATRQGLFMR